MILKEADSMNALTRSITKIFTGAAKAFQTFPATIACALAFAIVTIIRIHLDWPQQENWNFMFNCLHWAFALGALFSLAAITAAQSRYEGKRFFAIANAVGAAAALLTFLALYFFGQADTGIVEARYATVSGIAAARVSAAMLISFLVFVVLAGYPKEEKDRSDFARSLFMSEKAFFIALIYGLVIMAGASGVAGAFETLVYNEMSSKVYMYIGTLAGFLAFTIFVGYFPDFRLGKTDEHREVAQKQPRFVEILFGFIMIPIVLALTVVLLIWAGRTIMTGSWPSFVQLASIASSYAIGGIWLHMMVTHHESGLVKFYRKAYPISAMVILVFEAWALLAQLGKWGLKTTEYSFALIWILAAAGAVLLLVMKSRAHLPIVALTCILALFSVLPVLGYHALPVNAQIDRLEKLLVSEGLLQDGMLVPSTGDPELAVRESITDAVNYLVYSRDAKLPAWLDKDLGNSIVFEEKLGFEQAWPKPEDNYGQGSGSYMATQLELTADALDISDYHWMVRLRPEYEKAGEWLELTGDRGKYKIRWTSNTADNVPSLTIMLDDRIIIEQDMNDYIDKISIKYPPGRGEPYQADAEDMSLSLETPEMTALLVFQYIEIGVETREDYINYWMDPFALYIKEKS